jgi:transposase
MLFPEGQVRIFVYGEPVNMRLSYDGLYAKIRIAMGCDPMSRHLFAFINRRATQIKVIYWDRSSFCIWSKRLEMGRLISDWQSMSTLEMDWTQLKMLLEGVEIKRTKIRGSAEPRTRHHASVILRI